MTLKSEDYISSIILFLFGFLVDILIVFKKKKKTKFPKKFIMKW